MTNPEARQKVDRLGKDLTDDQVDAEARKLEENPQKPRIIGVSTVQEALEIARKRPNDLPPSEAHHG